MTFNNWHLIAIIGFAMIALSPFAYVFPPRKYALHLVFDGCAFGVIYFGGNAMSLPACILCVPMIIIGISLLKDHRPN